MLSSLKMLVIGCAAATLSVSAQYTAKNYDTPSYVQFSSARFEVNGTETNAVVTVVRSGDYRKTAAVGYITQDGTAAANVDFQPCGGTIVFSSGQSVRTITIPILRETSAGAAKSFQVQLQEPAANTIVLTDSAEIEIMADLPSLEIELAGGGLLISWPDTGLPYQLEAQVNGFWSAVTTEAASEDGVLSVTVAPEGQVVLFRLRLVSTASE